MQQYLKETEFINFSHPLIREAIAAHTNPAHSPREKAVALYYFVRDQFLYDPYTMRLSPLSFTASEVMAAGRGQCISKAALYAALLRGAGVPARLGFADVKNHLTSERLARMMDTDIFYFHGYTEVFLGEAWVKATPAFNLSLCERAGTLPLEFDGVSDSIFHPFDKAGARHMEYVNHHGHFDDVPYATLVEVFARYYGAFLSVVDEQGGEDFQQEVALAGK